MGKKIYFLSPSNAEPTGGVKQIYRQANILRGLGLESYLLIKKKDKSKNKWYHAENVVYNYHIFKRILGSISKNNITFYNRIKSFVASRNDEIIGRDSIVVLPEIYGSNMHKLLPENHYVIFNQNCYYTFQHYSTDYPEENPYTNSRCLGVIVASDDAHFYLSYTFPDLKIFKITLGIDDNYFFPGQFKKKKIAYMPRKLQEDSVQVINILKARKNLKNWEFFPIDNLSEREVASHMKESVFFLSFNHREGFGLPPVEAMACGCFVIGYAGQAGKEYFHEEFSAVIPDGDIITFVKTIEAYALQFEENEAEILQKGKKASSFVLEKYSMLNEELSTKKAWQSIITQLD